MKADNELFVEQDHDNDNQTSHSVQMADSN
jgi:hypothetical protein